MGTRHVLGAFGLVASLGACSSGGGSESAGFGNVLPFSGFSAVPENGQVQLNGEAVRTTLLVDASGNIISIGSPTAAASSSSVLTTEAGTQVGLAIDRSGTNIAFDSRQGDLIQRVPGLGTVQYASASNPTAAVLSDPDSTGFEYQTFGAWARADTPSQVSAGVGSFGSRTPDTGVPAAGTSATYTGGSVGLAQVADGTVYDTESNVTVSTDFTTATITSSGTSGLDANDLLSTSTPLPDLDFTGAGPVSGSRFTANVSGGTGGSLSGTARGQFYGPAAEETGGTFSATGGGTTYFGAFGAAQ